MPFLSSFGVESWGKGAWASVPNFFGSGEYGHIIFWLWYACIPAISFWCIPASKCWLYVQHILIWAWCRNINRWSNLLWVCTSFWCLQLNGRHRPYLQTWHQNCHQRGWRWAAGICAAIGPGCWRFRDIQTMPVFGGVVCWQEYPPEVGPKPHVSSGCIPTRLVQKCCKLYCSIVHTVNKARGIFMYLKYSSAAVR